MSKTWLVTHPSCLQHDTGPGHPERIERLRAILDRLNPDDYPDLERIEAPCATREQLLYVHDADYVEDIFAAIPRHGYAQLDPDTVISPASGEAALRAAGAMCAGIDAVVAGKTKRVFCAVRPPGHHAERHRAMGFCLFNNIAIGAFHALQTHGIDRVAVIDFDVHHGNGSQQMLADRPEFVYASTHAYPFYPGTGDNRRTSHNIRNVPLGPHTDSEEFRHRFQEDLVPFVADFSPHLILVSAGFDAHRADPLAHLELETEDYRWATEQIVWLADCHAEGRIVSTLEGGYDLRALADSAAAHVEAMTE